MEEVLQVLVHWKGKIAEETWQDAFTIESQFPNFSLGDKAVFSGVLVGLLPRKETEMNN